MAVATNPLDIIFLLDKTGSINPSEFDAMKAFIQAVKSDTRLSIGGDDVRIGVITWGHAAEPFIRDRVMLNPLLDRMDLLDAVDSIIYGAQGGLSSPLGAALVRVTDAFEGDFGARTYSSHIVIVLVDGVSSDDLSLPAGRTRDANIVGYAIGVHGGTIPAGLEETLQSLSDNGDFDVRRSTFTGLATTTIASDIVTSILQRSKLYMPHVTHATTVRHNTVPFMYVVWECELLTLMDGDVEFTAGTRQGSTATFFCEYGYELSSTSIRICSFAVRGWTGSQPTCNRESHRHRNTSLQSNTPTPTHPRPPTGKVHTVCYQ